MSSEPERKRELLISLFPGLETVSFDLCSDPTPAYNCIAFAAGDTTRNWDGWPLGDEYWPEGDKAGQDVACLVSAFAVLGYKQCEHGDLQDGVEKVAIYGSQQHTYEHVAKQRTDGKWESKIGKLDDIAHDTPQALEGKEYGIIVLYMSRKRSPQE